jgi:hypothetical protein
MQRRTTSPAPVRRQSSASTFAVGDTVLYDGAEAKVVCVHRDADGEPPYYTIKVAGEQERQTVGSRLEKKPARLYPDVDNDADAPEEPCCRICFDSTDSRENPLFRPCLCKGTSAWVHMECLDTWRKTSVNPKSFYECDSCKFKYKFRTNYVGDQLFLARLLSHQFSVHALTVLALCAIVFLAGFVGKSFDPSLEWMDVLRCFNLRHILAGATTTGLGSLMGWATAAGGIGGGGHLRWFVGDAFTTGGDRGRGGGDVIGTLIMAAAVIAGLCLAFYWIYERLEEWARSTTRHATRVILDVQGGVAPPPPRPRYAAVD